MTTTTDQKALLITRHLPVKIDQYRRNALGDEMAQARGMELRITEQLKRIQTSLKAQIVEEQGKQTVAAEAINAGFEMKEIACRQVIDLDRNTLTIYREDTGDKVDERALEPKERESLRKVSPIKPSPTPSTKEANHGV